MHPFYFTVYAGIRRWWHSFRFDNEYLRYKCWEETERLIEEMPCISNAFIFGYCPHMGFTYAELHKPLCSLATVFIIVPFYEFYGWRTTKNTELFFTKLQIYLFIKVVPLITYYVFFGFVFFEASIVDWWHHGCNSWLLLPIFIIFFDNYFHAMWYLKVELMLVLFVYKLLGLPNRDINEIKVEITEEDCVTLRKVRLVDISYLDFK